MKRFRAHRAGGLSGLVTVLSIAMLSQLNPAGAAEGKGAADAALLATPSAEIDKSGLREPSVGGPLVIRGTRPEDPNAAAPANTSHATPVSSAGYGIPANLGFQPGLAGNGWNARYDYGSLDIPVTPR